LPQTEEDIASPDVRSALDQAKTFVRWQIQEIFRRAEQDDAEEKKQHLEQVRTELAQRNRPSTAGTVAEIAAKYGISKSEVRRLRADGTLEETLSFLALKKD
jgi:DNA-directed RNA polymerase specialized sigma subunit